MQQQVQIHAFTLAGNGILNRLVGPCEVSAPLLPGHSTQKLRADALWDTGATNSVITRDTALRLGLKPISKREVHHAGGTSWSNVYLVNIHLSDQLTIQTVQVTECADTGGQFGLIIGMDIITLGDLSISNTGGCTVMSFRIPSIERVDFVQSLNKSRTPVRTEKGPGRNDSCPCGSGKKFKQCCEKASMRTK